VYAWLKDHVAAGLRFVTQNGLYDWGWLRAEADIRMPPGERIEEIGALATLVDENRYAYGLDALCAWRGLPGKDDSLLREGCATLGLINKRKKFRPQNYIHRLPARFVGDYAERDGASTFRLFESLDPVLDRENTRTAYRLECDLLPMVLEMRRRGVCIDVAAAERTRDLLLAKRDAVLAEISDKLGAPVSMFELARNKWLAEIFDREGIKYPRTDKGNPSFTGGQKGWMDRHAHWLPQLICKANKYHLAGAHFIEKYILDYVVNGRIHAEIHPHRSEANGTKSFRFSYSDPPLQLMSSRDEELTVDPWAVLAGGRRNLGRM
jgi:DNA polymerase-1